MGVKRHYLDVPPAVGVTPSGEVFDGVIEGHIYTPDQDGTTTLSYSFPGPGSLYTTEQYPFDRNWPNQGLESMSPSEQALFEILLADISRVSNLSFVHVEDGGVNAGTLRPVWFSGTSVTFGAYAEAPYPANAASGDMWFSRAATYLENPSVFRRVMAHELGHAIGLKHPFEVRGEFGGLPPEWHGQDYTVMAYRTSARFNGAEGSDLHPQSFMYLDIMALQYLYGVDTVTTAGADTYDFDQTSRHFLTVWDYSGVDTIGASNGSTAVDINLTPGTWSNVGTTVTYYYESHASTDNYSVYIADDTIIENAYGADGHDTLQGNDVANRLWGNGGFDRLYGGAGNDTLRGDGDADVSYGGDGDDRIWAGATDDGGDFAIGGAGNDIAAGGKGDDLLVGGGMDEGDSRQLLTGATSNSDEGGQDTLYGGLGNDTLIGGGWDDGAVDDNGRYDAGEEVVSNPDANMAWAGAGDDLVFGAAGADALGGGAGDDSLNGGDGHDTLYGGQGDGTDTGVNDVIDAGAGNDFVYAGGGADSLLGGAGDDNLFSGAGNDTVDGGDGDDTLWGGAGDDTFTGGEGADTFIFAAGHGADTVTDFNIAADALRLTNTTTNFTSLSDVEAAATEQEGGLLIDLGGGDSLFLQGLSVSDLADMNITL